MKRNLLFLAGGIAFCSLAYALTPDFTMSFSRHGNQTSQPDVKVSNQGNVRFNKQARLMKAKSDAPEAENQDDLYNVDVLLKEDFSSLGAGNMENPTAVNITEENGDLKGLPGWSGVNVYDAGNAVYVDVKFIIYEDEGWGEAEGEIWTAPVRNVAGKTLRLKADVKGVASADNDEEMFDSMNCIFMAYTDELPGERTMIDFPYFNISSEFETEEVSLEIPETATFYNDDDEQIECPISYVRVKLQPMQTPFFISNLELATVSPKVAIPEGLSFGNFTADGYTAKWDAVAEADKYSVQFYTSEFDADELEFALTPYTTIEVTEPLADVKIDTNDPTFFQVTAYKGAQPSPKSEMHMVFSALPPQMSSATEKEGKVEASWIPTEGAAGTEIFAYRQISTGDAGKNYTFLDIDFSNATSEDDGDEILWLDDYAYGWAALPYPSIEDGAVVINNSGAMWGMPTAKLISTNTYDLSKTNGKVKMIVNAKTSDYAGIMVAMGGTDEETGETITLDADGTKLTTEFADYEFELEGSNSETMFLVQADNSLGTIVVRSIKIIADFPDNSEIGYPYYSDYVNSNSLSFDVPTDAYNRVKIVGRSVKQINAEMMGFIFTIAEAVSKYSEPVYTSGSSAVEATIATTKEAEYYTVDGRLIESTRQPETGIYIVKTADKTQKIMVK